MERQKQIELMKSAEMRTSGYLRGWMEKSAAFRAELKKRPETDTQDDEHYQVRVRKHA